MTVQIFLLNEHWPGYLGNHTKENGKLEAFQFKKSKSMPLASYSRTSQFPQLLGWKMAHKKVAID
jgi:hypothetical protein